MIPHIIHYCWFGDKEKPADVLNYISSWGKIFPDYKIIEWNENNFDVSQQQYTLEAYSARKYAFVSDYVRLYALYTVGGLYFDTDIEARKNIDVYLDTHSMLLGFEDNYYVMTGFMAAEPGLPCFKELIETYNKKTFIQSNGKYDLLPNPVIVTRMMIEYGLTPNGKEQTFGSNYKIYPTEYFSGYNISYQKLEITDATCLIHHCMGSWQTPKEKFKPWLKSLLIRIMGPRYFDLLKKSLNISERGK